MQYHSIIKKKILPSKLLTHPSKIHDEQLYVTKLDAKKRKLESNFITK